MGLASRENSKLNSVWYKGRIFWIIITSELYELLRLELYELLRPGVTAADFEYTNMPVVGTYASLSRKGGPASVSD
jgi:hypothetical protein